VGPVRWERSLKEVLGNADAKSYRSSLSRFKPSLFRFGRVSMKPAGKPVSQAVEIRGHLGTGPLRHALRIVDRVHGDGDLPPLSIARAVLDPGRLGRYKQGGLGIDLPAGPHPHPELTTLHEIGHWLDNLAFGGNRVDLYASEESPHFKEWRRAVRASAAYKNLEHLRDTAATLSDFARDIGTYLSDRECFARCYAEYIAIRSGDVVSLRQLDRRLQEAGELTVFWEYEDFRGIADSLDRLFRSQGWMR
jgi:hypothetical protein